MNVICSLAGIVNPRRPDQGLTDIADAGFAHISMELFLRCPGYELEHYGEREREETAWTPVTGHPSEIGCFFRETAKRCREKGLQAPIARAPFFLRDTERMDMIDLLTQIQEACIRSCGENGCRYLVVRPLAFEEARGREWELNHEYYIRLAAAAKEYGVMILLENQCRTVNGHMTRGVCSDPEKAAQWVDELNRESGENCFGFCMDTGICSLCGQDMHEFAMVLGDRIQAVLLRDCDGQQESSMLPFTCAYGSQPQTDWLGLIRGLRETGFDGQLVLELADTAAAFSPILRPKLLSLAKDVAEYIRWQAGIENLLKKYRSVVLFGAGNMCRNYMKCYGEKYPPLFTCDNNRAVWGTDFCGLEVKSPEALKDLPKDCGIFICNIYYREIQRQLQEMGIDQERIEFFNDEYMPSFYFDRLKGV